MAALRHCEERSNPKNQVQLLHSSGKKERRKYVKHHYKRKCHQLEDGETHKGSEQENPSHLVAFPFDGLHLEGEKAEVAHHQIGEDNSEVEAGVIVQRRHKACSLAEGQRQRGDEDGHGRRRHSAKRGLLRVVNIELGQADG